jgi:hypothetical protein
MANKAVPYSNFDIPAVRSISDVKKSFFVLDKKNFGAIFPSCRQHIAGTNRHRISTGEIAMGVYEKQIQATGKYYDPQMHKTERNGGEKRSSVVPGSDRHAVEWAEVLRDLEAYY